MYQLTLDLMPYIIDQRKALCRQRISKSDCARKYTADINILITSKNIDRKIMHFISISTGSPTKIRKRNKLSQSK